MRKSNFQIQMKIEFTIRLFVSKDNVSLNFNFVGIITSQRQNYQWYYVPVHFKFVQKTALYFHVICA